MASQLLVVRHGQTEWSVKGKHTGLTDIGLTDTGRDEAADAARTLHEWTIDRSYSSPLRRARETAEIVARHVDLAIELDPMLVEWDYGIYEGRRTADTRKEIPDWSVWTHEIIAGESVDQVGVRADRFLARFERDLPDGTGVVFAHGHFLSILIARWCGLDPVEGRRFALATATVSLLGSHREDRVLRALNHRCGDSLQPPVRDV